MMALDDGDPNPVAGAATRPGPVKDDEFAPVALLVSEDDLWRAIEQHKGPMAADEVDFGFADFGVDGYKKFVFNEYRALNLLTADELVEITTSAGFKLVRQERRSVDMEIPQALRGKYPDELLLNNEIFLLLGK